MRELGEPMMGTDNDLIEISVEIVSAYVSKNALSPADLTKLIGEVHTTLKNLGSPTVPEAVKQEPAIAIKKSITPDYIICLEDGKQFKSLKRHLRTTFDLTPEQYREKWNLPSDYPMVAPNYAATRSALAKSNGLGRKAGEPVKKRAAAKG